MSPRLSSAELEQARARDPQALGRFFDVYFGHVYGLVRRLLGNEVDAEDAAQEVFLKVHRAIDRIDPDRDPSPWLTTIAYNVCRDRWRSSSDRMNRRALSVEDKPQVANQILASDRTDDGVLRTEREQLVRNAIDELPPPQREVVLMHDYEGMTHEQIGKLVGASHAAIRKRYSRALAVLAKSLRDVVS